MAAKHELLSIRAFARRCQPPISHNAVMKAVNAGRLTRVDTPTGPKLLASDAERTDWRRDLDGRQGGRPVGAADEDDGADRGELRGLNRENLIARTQSERAKAFKTQLEAMALAGDVLFKDDVRTLLSSMVMAARSRLLAIPTRVAAELGPKTGLAEADIAAMVKTHIHEALAELAEFDEERYREFARGRGRKLTDGDLTDLDPAEFAEEGAGE